MEPVKSAIIGCGRMGAFTSAKVRDRAPQFWFPLSHAEAIIAHPRLKLTAFCDTQDANLTKAADFYGVTKRFSDHHAMLAEIKPSLLCIATRTLGRADIIEAAYEYGVGAIHTEKPLCNSVAELNKIASLFAKDDFFVTWGALRRYFSVYQAAINMANSGKYGRLNEIRVNFGSSALYWTHPHSLDLILFSAGNRVVKSVSAWLDQVENLGSSHVIANDPVVLSAVVHFEDGLVAHIGRGIGLDFVLSCEAADITVRSDGHKLELYAVSNGEAYPSVSEIQVQTNLINQGTLAPLNQLEQCLSGNQSAIDSNKTVKRDILLSQLLSFAIVQSHLEGSKPVGLSSIDPSLEILAKTNGNYA